MYKHLTHQELYYIWQHRINKFGNELFPCESLSELACRFEKHISTIYRVVKEMKESGWIPTSEARSRNKRQFKMLTNKIKEYIAKKLEIGWSPDVICGRMKKDLNKRVSFKTIYR